MLRNSKDVYIYDLPYTDRLNLCRVLDACDKWEELGISHMKYDYLTVQTLRNELLRGRSPTDSLLTMWGHQNHTVLELFVLLSRMKLYPAMTAIKSSVDEKYHNLIPKDVEILLAQLKINNPDFDNNIDRGSDKVLTSKKVLNNENKALNRNGSLPQQIRKDVVESNENNESGYVEANEKSPKVLLGKSPIDFGTTGHVSSITANLGEIPQLTYDELQIATNNWNAKSILGKGGFGTVFKGIWKCTKVAIKRIEKRDNQQGYNEELRQSFTELRCLYTYRHDNVLPLYGCSLGGPHCCLVYQYMSGGGLDKRLTIADPTKVLNWQLRRNIAIGTARGLQFLHTIGVKPLIHGDIKSANILLDANDQPRIGDFGLAREGPQSEYMKISRIQGTAPYLPDEFLRARKFSTKVDTYSFGVVLFEIGTSIIAYSDKREKKFLKDYVVNYEEDLLQLKDQRANGGESTYLGLMKIGKECVNHRPKDRPEMVQVLIQLEKVPV